MPRSARRRHRTHQHLHPPPSPPFEPVDLQASPALESPLARFPVPWPPPPPEGGEVGYWSACRRPPGTDSTPRTPAAPLPADTLDPRREALVPPPSVTLRRKSCRPAPIPHARWLPTAARGGGVASSSRPPRPPLRPPCPPCTVSSRLPAPGWPPSSPPLPRLFATVSLDVALGSPAPDGAYSPSSSTPIVATPASAEPPGGARSSEPVAAAPPPPAPPGGERFRSLSTPSPRPPP